MQKSYQEDPIIQKNRWLILIVINLFIFMSTLDGSIVNVALPEITKRLHLNVSDSEWIVTCYLMAICVSVLFFGKLGDIIGKVTIFRIGSAVFILGSLLCGFSHILPLLLVSRVIQAIGASMTMSSGMGIVTEVFPVWERGKALGLTGTFVSLGGITGPGLGGLLVGSLGWEYIFWVNVPIGIILLFFEWKILPQDISKVKSKIDVPGTVLFAIFVVTFFTAILLGQSIGYDHIGILLLFIVAIISFTAFIWVEKTSQHPMLPLSLFRHPLFSISVLTAFLVFVANFCFNIMMPFYTQSILGMSPSQAGFFLMLFPVMMAICAPLSGTLSDRIGSELLTFVGLIILILAQIGLLLLDETSSPMYLGVLVAALGMGNGIFQAPNSSITMSTVQKTQLGIAGSVTSLMRNMGMVVGISVATTMLFLSMSNMVGYRVTSLIPGRPEIFIHGMRFVFIISTSICLVGTVLTGIRLLKARQQKMHPESIGA